MAFDNPGAALTRNGDDSYTVNRDRLTEDDILAAANEIIEHQFRRQGRVTSTAATKRFLRYKLPTEDQEQLVCLFLDRDFGIITWRVLFRGVLKRDSVSPGEVVRRALLCRYCTAVILVRQYPGLDAEPAIVDHQLARQLRSALATVDIELFDYLVAGARHAVSLVERDMF